MSASIPIYIQSIEPVQLNVVEQESMVLSVETMLPHDMAIEAIFPLELVVAEINPLMLNMEAAGVYTPPETVYTLYAITGTHVFRGGTIGGAWFVDRWLRPSTVNPRLRATFVNNPSYLNLTAAWADRETLTYQ